MKTATLTRRSATLLFCLLSSVLANPSFADESFQTVLGAEKWKSAKDDVTITAKLVTGTGEEKYEEETTIYLHRGEPEKLLIESKAG